MQSSLSAVLDYKLLSRLKENGYDKKYELPQAKMCIIDGVDKVRVLIRLISLYISQPVFLDMSFRYQIHAQPMYCIIDTILRKLFDILLILHSRILWNIVHLSKMDWVVRLSPSIRTLPHICAYHDKYHHRIQAKPHCQGIYLSLSLSNFLLLDLD